VEVDNGNPGPRNTILKEFLKKIKFFLFFSLL
jgi:hypothetical protein